MKLRRSQPVIPATVLAAAVMLSITSAADVTMAAVLMNAGRQVPARALADAESLGQWLSRFADAARQMRDAFAGDEAGQSVAVHAADVSAFSRGFCNTPCGSLPQQRFALPFAQPLLPALTDLPPPVC